MFNVLSVVEDSTNKTNENRLVAQHGALVKDYNNSYKTVNTRFIFTEHHRLIIEGYNTGLLPTSVTIPSMDLEAVDSLIEFLQEVRQWKSEIAMIDALRYGK